MNDFNKCRLYNADCLKIMGELIEQGVKVDAVITDPPYGIDLTPQRKGGKFKDTKVINDDSLEWLDELVEKTHEITKNIAVVFCGWQTVDKFKIAFEKKFKVKNILVWNKDWFGMGNNYRPNYELIMLLCKDNIKTKSNNKSNILTYRRMAPNKMTHSCEKPVPLLEDLVYELTNTGDLILDCYMGTGSTGEACMKLDRKFIGIELDDNYFNIAKERIEKAAADGECCNKKEIGKCEVYESV